MISRDSLKGITSVIAVGLAIFQIYFTAGFGIIDSQLLRTIHLGIVLALVFLYFPPKKLQEGEREHPGWLALDLVRSAGPSPPRISSPPTSTTTWKEPMPLPS